MKLGRWGWIGLAWVSWAVPSFAEDNANLQYALQQAAEEAKANQVRVISDENNLNAAVRAGEKINLRKFQKDRAANRDSTLHKFLYFPKDTGIAEDDRRSDPTYGAPGGRFDVDADASGRVQPVLAKPSLYWVTASYIDTCAQAKRMHDDGQFSRKYNFGFWFGDDVVHQPHPTDWCAVLWIRLDPTEDTVANRQTGKISQVKLYVDSNYKTYGLEKWSFATDRDREPSFESVDSVYQTSAENIAGIHAAFDAIPAALPNLAELSRLKQVAPNRVEVLEVTDFSGSHNEREDDFDPATGKLIRNEFRSPNFPKDPYLDNQLKLYEFDRYAQCQGAGVIVKYQARFGQGRETVGWCKGDALPLFIDNEGSLTVLVRKAQ